jgi:hypothetical protein
MFEWPSLNLVTMNKQKALSVIFLPLQHEKKCSNIISSFSNWQAFVLKLWVPQCQETTN